MKKLIKILLSAPFVTTVGATVSCETLSDRLLGPNTNAFAGANEPQTIPTEKPFTQPGIINLNIYSFVHAIYPDLTIYGDLPSTTSAADIVAIIQQKLGPNVLVQFVDQSMSDIPNMKDDVTGENVTGHLLTVNVKIFDVQNEQNFESFAFQRWSSAVSKPAQ